jgi:hypothetical protein
MRTPAMVYFVCQDYGLSAGHTAVRAAAHRETAQGK